MGRSLWFCSRIRSGARGPNPRPCRDGLRAGAALVAATAASTAILAIIRIVKYHQYHIIIWHYV